MSNSHTPNSGETSASHRLGGIMMAVTGTSIYLISMMISMRSGRDTSWNLPLLGVFFLLLGVQQLHVSSLLKRIARLEGQVEALGHSDRVARPSEDLTACHSAQKNDSGKNP